MRETDLKCKLLFKDDDNAQGDWDDLPEGRIMVTPVEADKPGEGATGTGGATGRQDLPF